MNEKVEPRPEETPKQPQELPEEPGMLESIGSFPVWMLKIIQAATPDFLISKTPPKKKKVRI
jgi:hypothetical protein